MKKGFRENASRIKQGHEWIPRISTEPWGHLPIELGLITARCHFAAKLLSLVVLAGLASTLVRWAAEMQRALARVSVSFGAAQNFTDSTHDAMKTDDSRQQVLAELRARFELSAKRYLSEG